MAAFRAHSRERAQPPARHAFAITRTHTRGAHASTASLREASPGTNQQPNNLALAGDWRALVPANYQQQSIMVLSPAPLSLENTDATVSPHCLPPSTFSSSSLAPVSFQSFPSPSWSSLRYLLSTCVRFGDYSVLGRLISFLFLETSL